MVMNEDAIGNLEFEHFLESHCRKVEQMMQFNIDKRQRTQERP